MMRRAARCMVPRAGEMLFRVGSASATLRTDDIDDVHDRRGGPGRDGREPGAQHREPRVSGRGYDLDAAKAQAFVNGPAKGTAIGGADAPDEPDGRARAAAARFSMMVPAGQARRQRHRAPRAAPRGGRHPDRRRQLVLPRHRSARRRARRGGLPLRRHGRVGRRGGRAARPGDHARRAARGVGRARAHPARDRRQGRGRRAVRRLHGAARRRALREDGAQRHRVRRHAAHRRGLRPAAPRRRAVGARDRRHLLASGTTASCVVPDRDHRAGPRAQSTRTPASRWSTSSSTRRSRRAPASGRARTRSTSARRSRRSTPPSRRA